MGLCGWWGLQGLARTPPQGLATGSISPVLKLWGLTAGGGYKAWHECRTARCPQGARKVLAVAATCVASTDARGNLLLDLEEPVDHQAHHDNQHHKQNLIDCFGAGCYLPRRFAKPILWRYPEAAGQSWQGQSRSPSPPRSHGRGIHNGLILRLVRHSSPPVSHLEQHPHGHAYSWFANA